MGKFMSQFAHLQNKDKNNTSIPGTAKVVTGIVSAKYLEPIKSAPISLRMDKWHDRILGSSEEFSALASVHVKLIRRWLTGTILWAGL